MPSKYDLYHTHKCPTSSTHSQDSKNPTDSQQELPAQRNTTHAPRFHMRANSAPLTAYYHSFNTGMCTAASALATAAFAITSCLAKNEASARGFGLWHFWAPLAFHAATSSCCSTRSGYQAGTIREEGRDTFVENEGEDGAGIDDCLLKERKPAGDSRRAKGVFPNSAFFFQVVFFPLLVISLLFTLIVNRKRYGLIYCLLPLWSSSPPSAVSSTLLLA